MATATLIPLSGFCSDGTTKACKIEVEGPDGAFTWCLISSARATRNGMVKQLGEELLDSIIAAARAAAKAAREAEKARNEADPVWCAERDAKLAAEEERKAARALLDRTNPLVDFRYLKTGTQVTLEHGHRWEIVGNDYAEILVRPVGSTLDRSQCRRLYKPIKNDRIDEWARILDVKHVVEYHNNQEEN